VSDQTNEWGRRLEDLYDACMELAPPAREAFIQSSAGDDPELARQLRAMIRLENPVGAMPLSTVTHSAGEIDGSFEFKTNTVFGKCRIISERGTGGMGAVYLALDLENHDRAVALKVMKPTLLRSEDRQRFSDETSALSRLVHPNIAQLYYWGIQPWEGADRPFLVMEYVDGQTLDNYLAEHKPTDRQVLQLLRKICLAVHYGHGKGVFHRDLKPSNILVTREGEPKLIDFGVSFTVSTDSAPGKQTTLSENVGTTPYMAPEVAGGQPFVPDPRTDVYSLGIIAFESLAGRRPGAMLSSGHVQLLEYPLTIATVRRQIAACERERLRLVDRRFRGDLDLVIARSLALKMDQRYPDAGAFAEDLRRLIDLEPVRARPASRVYTAKMFLRRNRLAVTAGAMVFTAILLAGGIFRIETVARRAAMQRDRENQQQKAAAHERAGQLAEQRGDWAAAADEYRAAEESGYPNRQEFLVGELRALDHLGRVTDAKALIARVQTSFPEIARSPGFEAVEGFFYWPTNQGDAVVLVHSALASRSELSAADRAYAEALVADDIPGAAEKLHEALNSDRSNRDAWAALALCDLVMGDAQKCEQDAGVMQRLSPGDGTGAVLAALGCAFEGRRVAAIANLEDSPKISAQLRSSLLPTIDFICNTRTIDQFRTASMTSLLRAVHGLDFSSVIAPPSQHAVPIPLRLEQLASSVQSGVSLTNIYRMTKSSQPFLELIAQFPNGDGECAAGLLAMETQGPASAEQHLRRAMSMPCLIDCQRWNALLLTAVHGAVNRSRNAPDGAAVARADLDRLIALGGIFPDKFPEEKLAMLVADAYGLHTQVRTLAYLWLSRAPDDPSAIYYLALADFHLGQRDVALPLFNRVLKTDLPDNFKADARAKITELTAATTKP